MGDISLINSEAIVHPTNATYSTSGQVGQVLSRAGGLLYQTALDSLKAAGNLPTCGGGCRSVKFICCRFKIV